MTPLRTLKLYSNLLPSYCGRSIPSVFFFIRWMDIYILGCPYTFVHVVFTCKYFQGSSSAVIKKKKKVESHKSVVQCVRDDTAVLMTLTILIQD